MILHLDMHYTMHGLFSIVPYSRKRSEGNGKPKAFGRPIAKNELKINTVPDALTLHYKKFLKNRKGEGKSLR